MPTRTRSDETAAARVPPRPTLPKLRAVAARCRACDLWKRGTQTVFGEGSSRARVMLVGEFPRLAPRTERARDSAPVVAPARAGRCDPAGGDGEFVGDLKKVAWALKA